MRAYRDSIFISKTNLKETMCKLPNHSKKKDEYHSEFNKRRYIRGISWVIDYGDGGNNSKD